MHGIRFERFLNITYVDVDMNVENNFYSAAVGL